MAKQLKIWNGRFDQRGHCYVAAYSRKQAAELLCKAKGYKAEGLLLGRMIREIQVYFSAGAWGNSMDGIEPVEPCVYVSKKWNDKPKRVL